MDADIHDEKGAPIVFDEQSMTAHEVYETGVYHLADGYVVTDADPEADAARFQDGECTSEWRIIQESLSVQHYEEPVTRVPAKRFRTGKRP